MKTKIDFKLSAFIVVLLLAINVNAQVTIGGQTEPKAGATLDMNSDYKGTVVLQNISLSGYLDLSQFTTVGEAQDFPIGSVVYNTNAAASGLDGIGLYYWTGAVTGWKRINSSVCCDPLQSVQITKKLLQGSFEDCSFQGYYYPSTIEVFTASVAPGSVDDCTFEWSLSYFRYGDGSISIEIDPADINGNVFTFDASKYNTIGQGTIYITVLVKKTCGPDKSANTSDSRQCVN